MRSSARSLLFVAATCALAVCGVKRPPAVATTAPSGSIQGSGSGERVEGTASPDDRQPLDAGPDIQPLRDDSAAGQELPGLGSGEGGPLADIPFEFDRALLGEEATATLQKNARWLTEHPDAKVTIEGHCDQRGTVEYNLALGDSRARAVHDYLVSLGIAADRLRTVSYGKERPLDPEMTDSAWARNRRAHLAVSR